MRKNPVQETETALDPLAIRRLALDALVSEPTLRRALRGEPIRSLSRERISLALRGRGLGHLLPAADDP